MGKIVLVLFAAAVLTVFYGQPTGAFGPDDQNRGRSGKSRTESEQQATQLFKTMLLEYVKDYRSRGDAALIDTIRGTTNWTSGTWQG